MTWYPNLTHLQDCNCCWMFPCQLPFNNIVGKRRCVAQWLGRCFWDSKVMGSVPGQSDALCSWAKVFISHCSSSLQMSLPVMDLLSVRNFVIDLCHLETRWPMPEVLEHKAEMPRGYLVSKIWVSGSYKNGSSYNKYQNEFLFVIFPPPSYYSMTLLFLMLGWE